MSDAYRAMQRLPAWAGGVDSRLNDLTVVGLALAAVVVQRLVVLFVGVDGAGELVRRIVVCSATAFLALLALHFRRYVGAYLISLGIAMNLLVMVLHGGLMPVAFESLREHWSHIQESQVGGTVEGSKDVVLYRDDIRAEPLADRYLITIPKYGPNIYSLGDLVLFGGVVLAAGQAACTIGMELRRRNGARLTTSNAMDA